MIAPDIQYRTGSAAYIPGIDLQDDADFEYPIDAPEWLAGGGWIKPKEMPDVPWPSVPYMPTIIHREW